jgi:DNA-binding transcriptional MerR regulator
MKRNGQEMLGVPEKLYRIGELVRYSPFSRQTLHNYTIMGLIREVEWTQGGHRLYPESVFATLARIMQLKRSRTLSQIRDMLAAEDTGGVGSSGGNTRNAGGTGQSPGRIDQG